MKTTKLEDFDPDKRIAVCFMHWLNGHVNGDTEIEPWLLEKYLRKYCPRYKADPNVIMQMLLSHRLIEPQGKNCMILNFECL